MMDNYITQLLREFGLNEKEISIYLNVVGKNGLTAYEISKNTKIHKSTCYDVLNRLVEKGFVNVISNKSKRCYSINDLSKVLGRVKNKEAILNELIPKIKEIENEESNSIISVEEKNAFSEFNEKLMELAKAKKITFLYMISNSSGLTTFNSRIFHKFLFSEARKKNISKNIKIKTIWDERFRNDLFAKQFREFGKQRFLENLPNKSTTFIYDNYVAFAFINEKESYIEIKNKKISEEMKTYFEYLWEISNNFNKTKN